MFLSKLISAYWKFYNFSDNLITLKESWKKSLDQKKFVTAVLMDLPEAFDSIPHDLLISRMHACGF